MVNVVRREAPANWSLPPRRGTTSHLLLSLLIPVPDLAAQVFRPSCPPCTGIQFSFPASTKRGRSRQVTAIRMRYASAKGRPIFKKILAPIRGAHEDAPALDMGFLLASRFGARVEAFYAAPSNTASVTVDTVESKPSDEVAHLEGTELYRAALILFSERFGRATSIVPRGSGLLAGFSSLPGTEAELVAAKGCVSDLIIIAHPAGDGPTWPNLSLESAIREPRPVDPAGGLSNRYSDRSRLEWNS